MADKSNQQGVDKTDWSKTESVMRTEKARSAGGELVANPLGQGGIVPAAHSSVPSALTVAGPDSNAARGILTRFQESKLGRKAALRALSVHYESQLDILSHTLAKAAQVQKARADVVAEEYLKELDARQLEVLTQMGLRNKETRERALLDLTETTAAKLREVQTKDWPEELIRDTIGQLLGLRKRVVAEMMRELGGEYSDV